MSAKHDRVAAALVGQEVDRPPLSTWRHFYEREMTGVGLAEAMLAFQRTYDWDFMKVNPRAQYHVEDWGAAFTYTGDPYTPPTAASLPVATVEDWQRIRPLSPVQGALGEHLRALQAIKRGLKGEVPFVMTVFNPISVAGRLVKSEAVLLEHLREHPKTVHAALEAITETFCGYVTECLNAGADGIFLATTAWASHELLTDQEYQEFGRPYDLRVLDAAKEAQFNILHVCHSRNMLRSLVDYPHVHALNWDDRDATNPSLSDARALTSRALIGGVSRDVLRRSSTPEAVAQQVHDAMRQTGGRGFMLGPSCSISPRCPEANLRALKKALLT